MHQKINLNETQIQLKNYKSKSVDQLNNINQKIFESKKNIKIIMDNVHAIIWAMDKKRQITFMSDYVTELLGYLPINLIDSNTCLQKVHSRDQYMLIHATLKALDKQKSSHFKCRIKHINNSWRWVCVSLTLVILKDKSIQVVGFVHDAHQDYLQQKQIQRVNQQLNKKIKQAINENIKKEKIIANQARFAAMGEMVANIAHQWIQPLNSLSLIIEDIHEVHYSNQLNDKYLNQALDKALQQIDRMTATIDLFHSHSKKESHNLHFMISNVIKETSALALYYLIDKGIILDLKVPDAIYAYGSPEEVRQILQIIISNACDAILNNNSKNKKISIILTN